MAEHEESVDDYTMCSCGQPLDVCASYWGDSPTNRTNRSEEQSNG